MNRTYRILQVLDEAEIYEPLEGAEIIQFLGEFDLEGYRNSDMVEGEPVLGEWVLLHSLMDELADPLWSMHEVQRRKDARVTRFEWVEAQGDIDRSLTRATPIMEVPFAKVWRMLETKPVPRRREVVLSSS